MPERMAEYCVELIRSREPKSRFEESPLICPIVIYTGRKRWDAERTIKQENGEEYGIKELEYPTYNLVDINDYTKEELLEERTGISKAMLFEKIETKEEIEEELKEIIKRGASKEEKKYLELILEYSNDIAKKLGEDTIKKYQEKIEGGDSMTNFEKLYIELLDDKYAKGMKEGKENGRKIGIIQVAREMVKNKMKDSDIIKMTHISEEELEKLKMQIS